MARSPLGGLGQTQQIEIWLECIVPGLSDDLALAWRLIDALLLLRQFDDKVLVLLVI